MTNQELLTTELVKHILGIFGLSHPFISNLIGITFDKFQYSKLSIEYEDIGTKIFPIYSALTKTSNNSVINVKAIYLSDGEDYELCAVFRCDDLLVYGVKYSSHEPSGIFLSTKSDNNWENPPMSEKLMATSGLELLNNVGISWKQSSTEDFLHSCLLQLVEM